MGGKWKQLKKAKRNHIIGKSFWSGIHYLICWKRLYTEFGESVAVVDCYLYPFGIPQS